MKDIDKQLSHTELREQRRINREARKASLEKTEVGKQTKSSDILQSLRHANRSQPSSSSKSASEIPPDKHHSRGSGSSEPVIRTISTRSGGNGGSPESKRVNALSHQTRPTNVSDIQREKETPINFPLPHDPVWDEVNEEIKVALTNIFPTRRLKHLTPGVF